VLSLSVQVVKGPLPLCQLGRRLQAALAPASLLEAPLMQGGIEIEELSWWEAVGGPHEA
jgi:hypothetical protein